MRNFKLILFILMLAVAGYLVLFQNEKTIVVDNPTLIIEDEKNPEETTLPGQWQDEETEFYKITYQLSGIDDEDIQEDIDRFVSDKVLQFKTDGGLESLTEEDKEMMGFNRGIKYTLDFTYTLKESEKIKSYILKTASYTGGAHGNLEVISYNYDKESGKRLALDDVFKKPSSEYLSVLAALGDKFLDTNYPEVAFHEGLEAKPANWSVWYATDTSLVFMFQPYQVVPYAYGTPEFTVVTKGVADFINMDYFAK